MTEAGTMTGAAHMNELLTSKQVAAWLNVPVRTLESWRLTGKGQGPAFIRIGPKLVRYRRSAVEAWLATQSVCGVEREQAG